MKCPDCKNELPQMVNILPVNPVGLCECNSEINVLRALLTEAKQVLEPLLDAEIVSCDCEYCENIRRASVFLKKLEE